MTGEGPQRPGRGRLRLRSVLAWARGQPLVVFLFLGLCVFALERITGVERYGERRSQRKIEVSQEQVQRLAVLFTQQSQRPPNRTELDGLVKEWIREEILFREALRLGLDRDDIIVRRRLAQKMDFLLADRAHSRKPSEDELRAYFEEHEQRFREPVRFSFVHVFFSFDHGWAAAEQRARAALARLDGAHEEISARALGDPFMLQTTYTGRSQAELTEIFGGGFARYLAALPVGRWSGPVPSAFGQHVVRVTARTEPRPAVFEAVRAAVATDLLESRRRQAHDGAFEALRRRYEIVRPEAEASAAAGRDSAAEKGPGS